MGDMMAGRSPCGRKIEVLSVGSAVPSQMIDNACLERLFGSGVAAAAELVGVNRRFWAVEATSGALLGGECTSALSARAAAAAMEHGAVCPDEIDLLVVATYTPDYPLPGTIPELLKRLRIEACTAYELRASCSGLGIALVTAEELLRRGRAHTALVVCCELNSLFLPLGGCDVKRSDWVNLALFSDGASALLLRATEEEAKDDGLIACFSKTLMPRADYPLIVKGGGAVHPPRVLLVEPALGLVQHDPKGLEGVAHEIFQQSIVETLGRAEVALEEVSLIIPPQANGYLYMPLAGQAKPLFYLNVDRYGNTTSASIGIALDEAVRAGSVKRGDLVLLLPFSAAKFVCAGALVRWTA